MADPGEGERQGQSIDQSGKTDYPKKLTTADDELWQILEETMSDLRGGGDGILTILEECYEDWNGSDSPRRFFKELGVLDSEGEFVRPGQNVGLRRFCEAKEEFRKALPGFAESAGIPSDELEMLWEPISEAVLRVRARVKAWQRELADKGKEEKGGKKKGGRGLGRRLSAPRSNIEIGRDRMEGLLKVYIDERGGVKMSFSAEGGVRFFNSPFSDRNLPVEDGLFVRSAKGVMDKLKSRNALREGNVVYVGCIARVVDLKVIPKENRNRHDFYVDVEDVSAAALHALKVTRPEGVNAPLQRVPAGYEVEDPEGEKLTEDDKFKGFRKLEKGTKLKGRLKMVARGSRHDYEFEISDFRPDADGYCYYSEDPKKSGRNVVVPSVMRTKAGWHPRPEDFSVTPRKGSPLEYECEVLYDGLSGSLRDGPDMGHRVIVESISGLADGRELREVERYEVLEGVLEIFYGFPGKPERAVFRPDGIDEVCYCHAVDGLSKKFEIGEELVIDARDMAYLLPDDFSKGRIGTVIVRGKAQVSFMKEKRDEDPDSLYWDYHQFFTASVKEIGEELLSSDEEMDSSERESGVLYPGDSIPGTLRVRRASMDKFLVDFIRSDWGEKRLECVDFRAPTRKWSLPRDLLVEDSSALVGDGFGEMMIGEEAVFDCDARFCCGTRDVSNPSTGRLGYYSVFVESVKEKLSDDCVREEKKEGELKPGDCLKGEMVLRNENGRVEVFTRFVEGMGPYYILVSSSNIIAGVRWTDHQGSKIDVPNEISTRNSGGALSGWALDKKTGGFGYPYAPIGGEEVCYEAELVVKGLATDGEEFRPIVHMGKLGKCLTHDVSVPDSRKKVETGLTDVKGRLVVENKDGEIYFDFLLDDHADYYLEGRNRERIPMKPSAMVNNSRDLERRVLHGKLPVVGNRCVYDVVVSFNPALYCLGHEEMEAGYLHSVSVQRFGALLEGEETGWNIVTDKIRKADADALARNLGGEESHEGALEGNILKTGCLLSGNVVVMKESTDGRLGMTFVCANKVYSYVDEGGKEVLVPAFLSILNQDEISGFIPEDCRPEEMGKHVVMEGCQIMFCDPSAKYSDGRCYAFLSKTGKRCEERP